MASKSDMPVIVSPPLPQILQNVFDAHWPTFEVERHLNCGVLAMRPDCLKYDNCRLPCELCNDDCSDLVTVEEGINPFDEEENIGCEKLHFKQDMGEI